MLREKIMARRVPVIGARTLARRDVSKL